MTTNEALRIVNFSLAMMGIVCLGLLYRHWKGYVLGPLTWLINAALFWAMRIFAVNAMGLEKINMWSLIVQMHALLLVLFISIFEIRNRKRES
jgi:hypothetical protein